MGVGSLLWLCSGGLRRIPDACRAPDAVRWPRAEASAQKQLSLSSWPCPPASSLSQARMSAGKLSLTLSLTISRVRVSEYDPSILVI